jgi:DNA-binding transcriptional LysR family regulator
LVLIVSPFHELSNQEYVEQKELIKYPFILREKDSTTRKEIEKILNEIGLNLEQLNIVAEFQSIEAIKTSVEANLGITIISKWSITKEIKLKMLKELKIKNKIIKRNIYLTHSKQKQLSPISKEFISFCRNLKDFSNL